MAVTFPSGITWKPLQKDAAGALLYLVGTDEAQVITKATTANFGAVNGGTTAAKVTGADSALIYRLTINAADTATLGPVVFESKGATSTTYVCGFVVQGDPTKIPTVDATGRVDLTTDSVDADALKTDAVTELVAAVLASSVRNYRPFGLDVKKSTSTVVPLSVAVHEAKTVTVSKNGGAFGATAGTVAAQVTGTDYKLTLHATDVDTLGIVAFLLTGATSTECIILRVVSQDPTLNLLGDATGRADLGTDSVDADALKTDAVTEIVTAILVADLVSYEATGKTGTRLADLLTFIRACTGGRLALSGTTLTVYEVDGVTVAGTFTLDSATMPRTRTTPA